MALTIKTKTGVETLGEGQVVAKGIDYSVRVMSDVWEDIPWAIIWLSEAQVSEMESLKKKLTTKEGGWEKVSGEWYASPWSKMTKVGADFYKISTGHGITAEIDADEGLIEAWTTYQEQKKEISELEAKIASLKTSIDRAWYHRSEIKRGVIVKVTKGRKVPIGTEGEVFWIGESRYGVRVGIKDSEGAVHWTAVSNVLVSGRKVAVTA